MICSYARTFDCFLLAFRKIRINVHFSLMVKSVKRLKTAHGQSSKSAQHANYRFEGDFRFVEPYIHQFDSYAKGRWLGRDLRSIVTQEFGAFSDKYWDEAIQLGFVRINGEAVSGSYIIKDSDFITHLTHRYGFICQVDYANELILYITFLDTRPRSRVTSRSWARQRTCWL